MFVLNIVGSVLWKIVATVYIVKKGMYSRPKVKYYYKYNFRRCYSSFNQIFQNFVSSALPSLNCDIVILNIICI
jgi:hypothetical protein